MPLRRVLRRGSGRQPWLRVAAWVSVSGGCGGTYTPGLDFDAMSPELRAIFAMAQCSDRCYTSGECYANPYYDELNEPCAAKREEDCRKSLLCNPKSGNGARCALDLQLLRCVHESDAACQAAMNCDGIKDYCYVGLVEIREPGDIRNPKFPYETQCVRPESSICYNSPECTRCVAEPKCYYSNGACIAGPIRYEPPLRLDANRQCPANICLYYGEESMQCHFHKLINWRDYKDASGATDAKDADASGEVVMAVDSVADGDGEKVSGGGTTGGSYPSENTPLLPPSATDASTEAGDP